VSGKITLAGFCCILYKKIVTLMSEETYWSKKKYMVCLLQFLVLQKHLPLCLPRDEVSATVVWISARIVKQSINCLPVTLPNERKHHLLYVPYYESAKNRGERISKKHLS
jgi:hypothetical protein